MPRRILAALDLHRDALGHLERAVRADIDLAAKEHHALRGLHGKREEEENEEPHSETRAGSRSSVSKKGSGLKRSRRATSMSGKDSMRVTYCCTAPL